MSEQAALQRRLGVGDAVVIGLGSMIGAGIFAALAPAASAAGSALLIGLAVAAVVAYCNAVSSARLAARYPQSGGTYVYGRERLGAFWGYLAGWSFVVGKTASCAAMALTVGAYAWPEHALAVAVGAVVVLTAVNYRGVQKSALLTRVIVAVVLAVLAAVVVSAAGSGALHAERLAISSPVSVYGVLQAAGLLFFAFAGYARHHPPGHSDRVGDHARRVRGGGGDGTGGPGPGADGGLGGAADRRRSRGRRSGDRRAGQCRRRDRRRGVAAVADPGRVPDQLGDGA
ncbi:Inner membrane transport protein YbaT [Tsukamurella paurometabola]|uniref:Inner membrane transport protein YbaT n=1 Tax=Tsukamurella paurometabola TaxID=2061 RepID=A0A3P8L6L3_TSUPA|nr:Inner membrane transport protein YbaT [Tsukamurella paurometabola]